IHFIRLSVGAKITSHYDLRVRRMMEKRATIVRSEDVRSLFRLQD
ncbi:hypothetical protein ACHAXS_008793, partial [Conticribra weissflogii]